MKKKEANIVGQAAEYFVMCQLLRQGLIAALAPVGVPNADIIVTNDLGDRLYAVQVKGRQEKGADGGWHMKPKHEKLISPSLVYCFVDFGSSLTDKARTWVIPSAVVADVVARSHRSWLATPGQKGQQRNDSDMRRLLPDYSKHGLLGHSRGWMDQYHEAWDLIRSERIV